MYGAILLAPGVDLELLVIRGRQSGKWSFPKGHGHSTENPLEACVREVKEETGISLKGIKPDDELRFKVGTYFVFYLTEKPVLCPEDTKEVMDIMWVPLSRLEHLAGNMDLKTFCNPRNNHMLHITQLVDKIESNSFISTE